MGRPKLQASAFLLMLLLPATFVWRPVYSKEPALKAVLNTAAMDRGLAARQNSQMGQKQQLRPCMSNEPLCVNAHAFIYLNKLRKKSKTKPLKMGSVQMTADAITHSKKMSEANHLITSDLMKINNAHWYKCGTFLAGEFVAEHTLPPPAHLDVRAQVPTPNYMEICMKPWSMSQKHLDAMTYDRIDDVSLGIYVDKQKNIIWCTLLLAVNTYPTCKRSVWNGIGAGGASDIPDNYGHLGAASIDNSNVTKPEANPFATASVSPSASLAPWKEIDIANYKYEYKNVMVKYMDGVNQQVKLLCFGENCRYCIDDKTWCYSVAFSVLVDTYLKKAIGKPKLF